MSDKPEVVPLNDSILAELSIEELEMKAELSPIGLLDLLATKAQLVSKAALLADCGSQCSGNCDSQCGSNGKAFLERESLILLP